MYVFTHISHFYGPFVRTIFPFFHYILYVCFHDKKKLVTPNINKHVFFFLKVLIFQNIAIKIVNSFAHLLCQNTYFFFVFKMTKLLDILIQMDILLPNSCMPTSSRKILCCVACQNPSSHTIYTMNFLL